MICKFERNGDATTGSTVASCRRIIQDILTFGGKGHVPSRLVDGNCVDVNKKDRHGNGVDEFVDKLSDLRIYHQINEIFAEKM